MRTEKEKMLAGELYETWDAELTNDRQQAKKLCFALNQTCPTEKPARQVILNQLLRQETDAWVESPFNCDFGYNITVGKGFYANHGCTILDCAPVTFGDNCLLAPSVVIATPGHPLDPIERASGMEFAKPITIGHNVCWAPM